MRELNECKAEIFRRSDERIKKRRKTRNRVLAWCIPFVLCISVYSFTILPAMMPANTEDMGAGGNESMIFRENASAIDCTYTAVEILDAGGFPGYYKKITDEAEVARMFSSIYSLFIESDGEINKVYMDTDGSADIGDQQTNSTSRYVITFITEDGPQTVYNLSQNNLLNASNNEQITLTNAQVSKLKEELGLSE